MSNVVRIHAVGGPEQLRFEPRAPAELAALSRPGPGQVRLRHVALGLNFIDVYLRTGLYPTALPAILGQEGAGVVEAVGEGVTDQLGLRPGDRVAYAGLPGAYAEERLAPADRLVKLPAAISDETAAAMMLKGLTAWFLSHRTHRVAPGDTVLVHAAAGGVGLLLCQWAKALGATVLGTVSTDDKAALARVHGCDHVILYSREKVPDRVRELTSGRGVRVVYDSVGKETFEGSLDSLAPLGLLVSFGNASGPVAPVSPLVLMQKGSLFLTRASLMHYVARREDLEAGASALFEAVAGGTLSVRIGQRFPLAQAEAAHRALESRGTTGSTLLLP